jgi:thiol-disulfide isomerase/thioredoxin
MKAFYTFLTILLLTACRQGDGHFTNIKRVKNLTSIVVSIKADTKIDSVFIFEKFTNKFTPLPFSDSVKFNFNISKPSVYTIMYQSGNKINSYLPIWLNNGETHIDLNISNERAQIDTVIGSPIYYETEKFYNIYNQIIKANDTAEINNFFWDAFQKNATNLFSQEIALEMISYNQNNKKTLKKLLDSINAQDSIILNSTVSVKRKLESKINVNKVDLSKFIFVNRSGRKTSLKTEKNNTYLLDFWFSNCTPCIKDQKIIIQQLDFFKEKKVEIISISTEKSFDNWSTYLKKNSYAWKNFKEITEPESMPRISEEVGIVLYPTYLWIESDGKIISSFSKIDDFRDKLKGR